jgi:tight adherence protein C
MNGLVLVSLAALFCGVFALSMLMMRWLAPNPVRERLRQIGGAGQDEPDRASAQNAWLTQAARLSGPLARLSAPKEGWEKTPLRSRFIHAGFRGEHAPAIFFGIKTFLMFVAPALVWLGLQVKGAPADGMSTLFVVLLVATLGLYLPNLVLTHLMARRQRAIVDYFPDALDLLTVCIEAGLAIDAALAKVAEEMQATAPVLSEELRLVTLELRAGSGRDKALRNLAARTGVEEVDTLVGMLIQAERFGTSIGASLRVHADALRTRRRQRAEEAAAKIALKLLFPLIFCIFPALMLVLLGPAILTAYKTLAPAAGL